MHLSIQAFMLETAMGKKYTSMRSTGFPQANSLAGTRTRLGFLVHAL